MAVMTRRRTTVILTGLAVSFNLPGMVWGNLGSDCCWYMINMSKGKFVGSNALVRRADERLFGDVKYSDSGITERVQVRCVAFQCSHLGLA